MLRNPGCERVRVGARRDGRVDAMWERLAEQQDGKWVVIFTHAMFIRAAILSLQMNESIPKGTTKSSALDF